MVQFSPADPLDAVFGALADPTRRALAEQLRHGEASVSRLADPFDLSLPAVLKHIRVLEQAGLVEHSKRGRTRYVRLRALPMAEAEAWLARYRDFWSQQLAGLAGYLEGQPDD